MWQGMILAFIGPPSLTCGIGSRPREEPGMPVVDTHAFGDAISKEGAHKRFDK